MPAFLSFVFTLLGGNLNRVSLQISERLAPVETQFLGPFCPSVLIFSGDLMGARKILSVPPRMLTGECIVETVPSTS